MEEMSKSYFKGPILVTGSFFIMYYCFILAQALSKKVKFYSERVKAEKSGKTVSWKEIKYGPISNDNFLLAADRAVGNTMEQQVPFLVSLWLHAIFVSPETATSYGTYYVIFRAIYPFVFYKKVVWISTVPNYAVICLLLYPVLHNAYNN